MMNKIIKIMIILVLICFLIIGCVSFYIGNYLYDYTLNPRSSKNIFEYVDVDENKNKEAHEWLLENSENITMTSEDHLKLNGYYIDQDSDICVIMIHGYRVDSASLISPIKKIKKQNYNILAIDLRGHGKSEGDYIGMGWDERKDVLKWIDYLITKNPRLSIFLYGISMGGATVMNVSGEKLPHQVKGIIEDCGYTDVWNVFKEHIDMNETKSEIFLRMASLVTLIRAGYRLEDVQPIEQVKKSKVPLLFIHGDEDNFIPSEMVYQLYHATKCEKELLVVKGAGHADSYSKDPQIYYRTIYHFIEKHI